MNDKVLNTFPQLFYEASGGGLAISVEQVRKNAPII